MMFSIPKNIRSIISIIRSHGYSAHLVGGCVRDMLIGKSPEDWDITTNAAPEEVEAMFQKTYDTGARHGTITVSFEGTLAEVTTWRTETQYSDHRRPDHIDFAASLAQDLSRRDFTINALAYHPDDGLIDPYNGFEDIQRQLIRCVGDPIGRFSEDALRMLRAVRFSAQLGFDIEENTLSAIHKLRQDLNYVSMERIQAEVNKILVSGHPERLELLWQTGLAKVIFPGADVLPPGWIGLARKLRDTGSKRILLLSFLFYSCFGSDSPGRGKALLNRLRYDRATLDGVLKQTQSILEYGTFSDRNTRRAVFEYGEEIAANTLLLTGYLKGLAAGHEDNLPVPEPIKPAVSGADLKNSGLFQGKDIKDMLSLLFHCLYENPRLNDKAVLLDLAARIAGLTIWTESKRLL